MQVPLQITFHDVTPSDALETHIRDKARKLEQFYAALIACKVVVDQPGQHQQKGKPFNIRILTGVLLYMFLWARRVQTYDL